MSRSFLLKISCQIGDAAYLLEHQDTSITSMTKALFYSERKVQCTRLQLNIHPSISEKDRNYDNNLESVSHVQ